VGFSSNELSPIVLERWAAWPPQLGAASRTNNSTASPPVSTLPMMTRRRLSPLGRSAFQAVDGISARDHPTPLIFSSRHGDVASTLKLLEAMAENTGVSPTGFSMSVHNAFAGLLSILGRNTHSHTAIAAGSESFSIGLVEMLAQLTERPELPVTLVYYDEALPGVYEEFDDGKTETIAFAGRFRCVESVPSMNGLMLRPEKHIEDERASIEITECECGSFIKSLLDPPSTFVSRSAGLTWSIQGNDQDS
jgi:hypothetical protein